MCSHCSRERFAKVLRKVCASHVGDLATLQKQLLFRLPIAFSRVGKKQIGSLNHFAFSRPGKKQIGSLDHFAFSQPGKKQIEGLDHFAFSRAGRKQIGSLSQIWKKQFGSDFNFFPEAQKNMQTAIGIRFTT